MKYLLILFFVPILALCAAVPVRTKRGFLGSDLHGFGPINQVVSFPVGYPPSIGAVPPVSGGWYPDSVEQPQQDVIPAPVGGVSEDISSDSISVEAPVGRSYQRSGFRRYPPIIGSDSVTIESASSFPGTGVVGGGGGAVTGGSAGSLLDSYVPSILGGIQSRQGSW